MTRNRRPLLAGGLIGIFLRSAVHWAARVFIVSWYVYYAFHFDAKVDDDGYMYWLVFLLSVFGLWQLIEVLAKATRLAERLPRP